MPLKKGAYDQLMTEALRRRLADADCQQLRSEVSELEEVDGPDYLARHVASHIRIALGSGGVSR